MPITQTHQTKTHVMSYIICHSCALLYWHSCKLSVWRI